MSAVRLAFYFVSISSLAFMAFGCSSGSGDNPGPSQAVETGSPYLSGLYDFKVEVASSNCSDGSQPRQGFGFSVEIIQNGTLIEARNNGQTAGRGDIDPTGKFHMSGSLEEMGSRLLVVFDGQVEGKSISGDSNSAWETADGLKCRQVSRFTAAPKQGGA